MIQKVECKECSWSGFGYERLRAQNPFDPSESIEGCPQCKSTESFTVLCDENGCQRPVACGTPTPDGFRWTCGEHAPVEEVGREVT